MAGTLDFYNYDIEANGVISQKQQQAKIDSAQNEKIKELEQVGGYPPEGGIPATDLASGVRTSLGKADTAYQKSSNGIPNTDLASGVQTSLGKADTAYQKPSNGIPTSDLASGVQDRLFGRPLDIPTIEVIDEHFFMDEISASQQEWYNPLFHRLSEDNANNVVVRLYNSMYNQECFILLTKVDEGAFTMYRGATILLDSTVITAELGFTESNTFSLRIVGSALQLPLQYSTLMAGGPVIPLPNSVLLIENTPTQLSIEPIMYGCYCSTIIVTFGNTASITFPNGTNVYYSKGFEVQANKTYELSLLVFTDNNQFSVVCSAVELVTSLT